MGNIQSNINQLLTIGAVAADRINESDKETNAAALERANEQFNTSLENAVNEANEASKFIHEESPKQLKELADKRDMLRSEYPNALASVETPEEHMAVNKAFGEANMQVNKGLSDLDYQVWAANETRTKQYARAQQLSKFNAHKNNLLGRRKFIKSFDEVTQMNNALGGSR